MRDSWENKVAGQNEWHSPSWVSPSHLWQELDDVLGVQHEICTSHLWPLADLAGVSQSRSVIKADSSLNTFNWNSGSALISPRPPTLPRLLSCRRMFSLTNKEIFSSLTFPECFVFAMRIRLKVSPAINSPEEKWMHFG